MAAGFHVTALSRASSTSTPPAGVEVKRVDYGNPEALEAALAGQDALVSTVTTAAAGQQRPFLDAAFAAGVKRVIPAEFGVNTRTLTHPPPSRRVCAHPGRRVGVNSRRLGTVHVQKQADSRP